MEDSLGGAVVGSGFAELGAYFLELGDEVLAGRFVGEDGLDPGGDFLG